MQIKKDREKHDTTVVMTVDETQTAVFTLDFAKK